MPSSAVPIRAMTSFLSDEIDDTGEYSAFLAIFATLTEKQHEVFHHVAEGRSAKEIAWRLGVTDSAVIQRIEAVRSRAGSPPRSVLARAYRLYLMSQAVSNTMGQERASMAPHPVASESADLGLRADAGETLVRLPCASSSCGLASSAKGMPPDMLVPRAFVGPEAALNRLAAIVVIAAGLLAVALVSLGVVQALATLLADHDL